MNEQDLQALLQNPKLNDIKELLTALESSGVKPKELINLISKKDNIQNSIDEIENIKNTWSSFKETISNLNDAIEDINNNKEKIDSIKDFHNMALVGNENQKSIKDEIIDVKKNCKELYDEYKNNFKELYDTNDKKINSLLGGATEASLSVGYKEKRKEIGESKKIWTYIFISAIVIFILAFGLYFYFSFQEGFSYIHFIRGLPIFIFSGFFCFYSTKQIEKYSRLEQEYAYKESLSKTYLGYIKQIEDLENDENSKLKNRLIEIMLKSAELNPSVTLEKSHGNGLCSMFYNNQEDKK